MKKAIITALMLGSAVFALPSVEAKAATTAASAAEPQINVQIGRNRRWNNRASALTARPSAPSICRTAARARR